MKKRKDGRYQKKVTLSGGRQRLVYGRTIAEVNRAADELKAQDRDGLAVGDTTTVNEWAKVWIQEYKGNLRNSTVNTYRNAYNVHILPHLGAMLLRDVRPIHVQGVMSAVSEKSESMQHKVLITMRQIFSTARQNGLVGRDPTEGVKTTPHARPKKKEYLTLDEQKDLLKMVKDSRALTFCALCLYCGLRREEALGLQWTDVDKDGLTVNRALSLASNQPEISQELKTKAAHRTVPIPSPLSQILKEVPRLGLFVVPCADGKPMTRMAFRRLWDKVQAVTPYHIHPHMLRHTYATSLYKAGVDMRTAQYLLGHSSIQMTANIYTHLEKEDAASSMVLLERYLTKEPEKSESSQKVVKTQNE